MRLLFVSALAALLGISGGAASLAETINSPASAALGEIETVGFDNKSGIGVGGMVIFEPVPVVLFRNGEALTSISGLNHPEGLAAHKRERSQDWTRWRRAGSKIEIQRKGRWEALPFTKTMPPLPRGHRMAGTFERLSGGGNTALGGKTMVAAWASYTFFEDGRFSTGGGAGGSSETESGTGRTGVVTSTQHAARTGTYEIDGYRLMLRYADGRTEHRLLVTDPSDPRSAIWLDGNGYARE